MVREQIWKDEASKQRGKRLKAKGQDVEQIKREHPELFADYIEPNPISPPIKKAKIQVQDQGPAAPEEKEPEPPKPRIRKEPKEKTEFTGNQLKALVMTKLAANPKKYEKYLNQLPHVWGGTRKGGSGWSTAWLAVFDIVADVLNELLEAP